MEIKELVNLLPEDYEKEEIIHYKKPKELEPYRVIAVDASDNVGNAHVSSVFCSLGEI